MDNRTWKSCFKNLNEKAAMKPQLLPLTEDIIKLKNFLETKSKKAYELLLKTTKTIEHYKTLVETTLILTILHNRKRVGDIQYLQQDSYREQIRHDSNVTRQSELTLSLSENEKILTHYYLRVVAIGKGSRAVTILIPKNLQKYFSMIDDIRHNTPVWFSSHSTYFFTYPHSNRWIDGCSVIRRYAKQYGARNPELLTSSRLRKHIATVTQVLNLKSNEIDQLAKFMGHTTRTHEQFYKLPQDIYQIAKVSKILQLMKKGNADQFKNRSLDEIDIDMENVLEDENISEYDNTSLQKASKSTTYGVPSQILENINTDILPVDPSSVGSTSSKHLNDTSHDFKRKRRNSDSANSDSTFIVSDTESSESDIGGHLAKKTNKKIYLSSDSDTEIILFTEPNSKAKSKQKWSQKQKTIMEEHFKYFIEKRQTPRKMDVENFIEKNKSFNGIPWLKIKTYIYNFFRLQ